MPPLIIRLTPGEPRRYWCETCQTSGGIEVDLYQLTTRGITRVATIRTCTTCEENHDG